MFSPQSCPSNIRILLRFTRLMLILLHPFGTHAYIIVLFGQGFFEIFNLLFIHFDELGQQEVTILGEKGRERLGYLQGEPSPRRLDWVGFYFSYFTPYPNLLGFGRMG